MYNAIMNSTNTCLCETNVGADEKTVCIIIVQVRRWMYLHIWCHYCYRPVMQFLHRFNLHYAPPSPRSPQHGIQEHWCKWCGLRGRTWKFDPNMSPSLDKPMEMKGNEEVK